MYLVQTCRSYISIYIHRGYRKVMYNADIYICIYVYHVHKLRVKKKRMKTRRRRRRRGTGWIGRWYMRARGVVTGKRRGGGGAGSILGNQIVVHGGAVSESLTINPRGVGPLNNKHGDRGGGGRPFAHAPSALFHF